MFVCVENPRFTHTVTVSVPTDGGHESATFRATFVVLGDSKLADFELADITSASNFLKLVFVDFADVEDAEGNQVLFSDRTRDWLIDLPFVRGVLLKAYFAGVYKASLGN